MHPNGSPEGETENLRCTTATDVKAREHPKRDISRGLRTLGQVTALAVIDEASPSLDADHVLYTVRS